jgi:hypothetical protein
LSLQSDRISITTTELFDTTTGTGPGFMHTYKDNSTNPATVLTCATVNSTASKWYGLLDVNAKNWIVGKGPNGTVCIGSW